MELRGVVSNKQILSSILEETFLNAWSKHDFYLRLKQRDLQLYSRGGRIVGISLNRRFRFKTLGYSDELLNELDKSHDKAKRLAQLQKLKENHKRQLPNRER